MIKCVVVAAAAFAAAFAALVVYALGREALTHSWDDPLGTVD